MFKVTTEHPFATWSPDFIRPLGSRTDSTVQHAWNDRLYDLILAEDVRLMDLGCAGGGTVLSVINDGGTAIGIDGSDYGITHGQGEWPTIPGNLFNADITRNFTVTENGRPATFNVVTLWEVLEHIPEELLPVVMGNVARHLYPDGIVVASISQQSDCHSHVEYHVCVHPRAWWREKMSMLGWDVRDDLYDHFDPHWVRGPLNGMDSFPMVLS